MGSPRICEGASPTKTTNTMKTKNENKTEEEQSIKLIFKYLERTRQELVIGNIPAAYEYADLIKWRLELILENKKEGG